MIKLTRIEKLSVKFLKDLFEEYGDDPHIYRVAPFIGPVLWKIFQVSDEKPEKRYKRIINFKYRDWNFRAKYNHEDKGRIDIFEVIRGKNVGMVAIIQHLSEAMSLELRASLEKYVDYKYGS